MARPFQHNLSLLPLLLLLLPSSTPTEEVKDISISVEAPYIAVEEGHHAEIECTSTEEKQPLWYLGANTTGKNPIPEDPSFRIYVEAATGKLNVKQAALNDSGVYLCRAFSSHEQASVELKVYDMPGYGAEGAAVIAVSSVLLVAMLGMVLYQSMKKRRQVEKSKAAQRQRVEV